MNLDDDILQEFVTESQDHLADIEDDFLVLGQQYDDLDPDLVNKVFRAIHSMKGSAGFCGLTKINELAHVMESLLINLRDGKITALERPMLDALLAGCDKLIAMINDVGGSNDMDIADEVAMVSAFLDVEGKSKPAEKPAEKATTALAAPSSGIGLVDLAGTPVDFDVTTDILCAIPDSHDFIYLIKCSAKEIKEVGGLESLLAELDAVGKVAHCEDLKRKGAEILFSTVLDEDLIAMSVGLENSCVTTVELVGDDIGVEEVVLDDAPAAVATPSGKPADALELQVTPEMATVFSTEGGEQLDLAEAALLELEKTPEDPGENVAEAFRSMHSFKGNCGLFGLEGMEGLSHAAENVLEQLKTGERTVTGDIIKQLLLAVDVLRGALDQFGDQGKVDEKECELLALELRKLGGGKASKTKQKAGRPTEAKTADSAVKAAKQDIRVDLDKLDRLINLAGELVIAEDMVVRHPAVEELDDQNLERAIHQLRRVSAELREVAMSARMIPLATTFRKMNRLVHDVSQKVGKPAKLVLIGEDTEVDKTVIEMIGDPLVHIVRNSIDHGLEPPIDRELALKAEVGTVTIEARHEGGEVWILISDDGRGLQREKILEKAIENGLVTGDGSDMHDDDVYRLIFEPGFSTAAQVSDISGRGVGMDVVKKNIEKLKGRIDVISQPGQGTTVILRIPLTLAIIEGMLVRVGDSLYTIPLLSIQESIRPVKEQLNKTPDGREFIRLRDEIIPIVRLHEVFRKSPEYENLTEGNLVILEVQDHLVGLFVDELMGQHETVIKGLSDYLGEARGVSGCTVLGNGEVSLIIDVGGIVEILNEMSGIDLNHMR